MTTQSNPCQTESIAPFLNGMLDISELATFEAHLDHCERCRESLDRAVASEQEWSEVRKHLTPLPASLTKTDSRISPSFKRRFVMFAVLLSSVLGVAAFLMPSSPEGSPDPVAQENKEPSTKYTTAQEAFQVGAAFYNSRNFKASREPLEAAIRLAKDDVEMKLKAYQGLLQAYRQIPEFEPYQTAAEFVIANHQHDATRSLTRRAYLSFAYNRGQMENLAKRHEKQLKKDPNNWMAVYLLSEIYSTRGALPPSVDRSKRAIELIEHLAKLDAERQKAVGRDVKEMSPAEAAKISREKGKLARQYLKEKDYRKAAELYEEIAPLDPTTHAWNLKEAAAARLKLGEKENALRLALAAEKAPKESRSDLLTHFFHRNLGDTFLALDHAKEAIPHYEIAIQKTTIEGYLKDTKASLQEATEKSKQ